MEVTKKAAKSTKVTKVIMDINKMILLTTLFTVTASQLYFSSTELHVYSKKALHNFHENEHELNAAMTNLLEYAERFRNSIETYKHTNKTDLKTFNKNLEYAMAYSIHTCVEEIYQKSKVAMNLFESGTSIKHRDKRGLPIIGELISEISDLPSPKDWSNEQEIVKHLNELSLGNRQEIHEIKLSIDKKEALIKNIHRTINKISKLSQNLDSKNQYFFNTLIGHIESTNLCRYGNTLANFLLKEAELIQKVHKNSLNNKPDESLFPRDKIISIIESNKDMSNLHIPLFRQKDDISELFEVSTAKTGISTSSKNNIIQYYIESILIIPLIEADSEFRIIHEPLITEKDKDLKMILKKTLDLRLCNTEHRSVRFMSSKDLAACKKTTNSKKIICQGRKIISTRHYNNPCGSKEPSSLVVELNPTKLLIKTHDKKVKLVCNEKESEYFLQHIFNIMHIPKSCRVIGNDFIVGKLDMILDKNFSSELKIFPLNMPKISKPFYVQELNITDDFNMTFKEFRDKLKKISMIDNKNQFITESMEKNLKFHKKISFSAIGLTVILTIGIASIVFVKICSSYRKRQVVHVIKDNTSTADKNSNKNSTSSGDSVRNAQVIHVIKEISVTDDKNSNKNIISSEGDNKKTKVIQVSQDNLKAVLAESSSNITTIDSINEH